MPTASIADQEVKEAMKAVYDADPLLAGVTDVLKEGKLPSPQVSPYANIEVDQGRASEYNAPVLGSYYKDYRRATFKCWGTKEQMVGVGKALDTAFRFADPATKPKFANALPVTTKLTVCRPVQEPMAKEDPTVKSGKPVWMLTAIYEVEIARPA